MIHDSLREWVRIEQERHKSPSEAIIDSQSVKSAAMVSQDVGFDSGQKIKGRKRFITGVIHLRVEVSWYGEIPTTVKQWLGFCLTAV